MPYTDAVRSQMSTDADVERAPRLVQSPGRAMMSMLRESDRRATNGACDRPATPGLLNLLEPGDCGRCDALLCDAPAPCTVVCRRRLSSSTAPLFAGWQRRSSRAPSRLLV